MISRMLSHDAAFPLHTASKCMIDSQSTQCRNGLRVPQTGLRKGLVFWLQWPLQQDKRHFSALGFRRIASSRSGGGLAKVSLPISHDPYSREWLHISVKAMPM